MLRPQTDPEAQVRRIAGFMGQELTDPKLAAVLKRASMDSMRKETGLGSILVRKGMCVPPPLIAACIVPSAAAAWAITRRTSTRRNGA